MPPSPFNLPHLFHSLLHNSLSLLLLCHLHPCDLLPPSLSSLALSLLAVKDVSVQLSQIMFACPAVKTGGCPFHSTSHTTKGAGREEGPNARVWTQAIIPNYCFSFQFRRPDGGPTRRTRSNPLRSSRISGPFFGGRARSRDSAGFHLNVSQELIQTRSDGRINPRDPAFNGLSGEIMCVDGSAFIHTGLSERQLLNQGRGSSPSSLQYVNPPPVPVPPLSRPSLDAETF